MTLTDSQRAFLEYMRGFDFWSLATPQANGCWIWRLPQKSRYGYCRLDGKRVDAHRVAYAMAKGDLPDGMVLHHDCLNPICVNPDHLIPMTSAEHLRLHRQLREERRREKEVPHA